VPFRPPTLKAPTSDQLALSGFVAALLELSLAALLLFALVDRIAPPQDLPWKPFSLNQPIGLATGGKLAVIARDPALCRAALAQGGAAFTEAPARVSGFCTTADSIRLTSTRLSPAAPVMRCDLALTYEVWARHVAAPDARRTLGARLTRIDHYGTYACRNIYGRPDARPSQHASARALDVAAFRLSDGRTVSVLKDFNADTPEGRFVRQARDGACGLFGAVLSPDYNAAHANHLHLDMSPYRLCR
jgi:hypothetical protein